MNHPKHIKRKSLSLYLFMLILGLAIVLRVSYTQVFESHIWNPENYNITRLVPIEASRGNIYSKDLSLLATSIPEYEIRWDATVSSTPFFKQLETGIRTSIIVFSPTSALPLCLTASTP